MRRSRTRTYGMTRRVSSPSRSKRNSMKRKLLKRNEMLYLVLRSQPRHRPPDLSDRKGGSALHTMRPPSPHEALPVEHNLALIPTLISDGDPTVLCRVERKGCVIRLKKRSSFMCFHPWCHVSSSCQYATKDGKLSVNYQGWAEQKIVLA